jgi:hypothetical protein
MDVKNALQQLRDHASWLSVAEKLTKGCVAASSWLDVLQSKDNANAKALHSSFSFSIVSRSQQHADLAVNFIDNAFFIGSMQEIIVKQNGCVVLFDKLLAWMGFDVGDDWYSFPFRYSIFFFFSKHSIAL